MTRLVFPTPGLPSRRIALFNCIPRNNLKVLKAVVGAVNEKLNLSAVVVPALPRSTEKGLIVKYFFVISGVRLSKEILSVFN